MFKKYQLRSYNFRLVILLIVTSIYGIATLTVPIHPIPSNSVRDFSSHFLSW